MKEGPDISRVAALIGDPARANMLCALMSGKALTATELAHVAGITVQTASSHLAKLADGGLLVQRKQGRHRYFSLSGADVGALLESMMGFAARRGHIRHRTGPRDPALRKARVCYNHLAGELAVRLFDASIARGHLVGRDDTLALASSGQKFFTDFGIDLDEINGKRRPLCRSCLDWSARRNHLAGALGSAVLQRLYALGWARRIVDSRVVEFTPRGEKAFLELFPLPAVD